MANMLIWKEFLGKNKREISFQKGVVHLGEDEP